MLLSALIVFFMQAGFAVVEKGFTGPFHNLAVLAAVNTLLASAMGGIAAMFSTWWAGGTDS